MTNNPTTIDPNKTNQPHRDMYEDEIDLGQIIKNIWRIRWKIVLFTALYVSLGLTYLGLSYFNQEKNQAIAYDVSLEGIVDEAYPNGMPFRLSHLQLPETIDKTLNDLDIRLNAGQRQNLNNAIQITYHNPDVVLLQQQYTELADQRNKDLVSIQQFQEAINEKLSHKEYYPDRTHSTLIVASQYSSCVSDDDD